MIKIVHLITDLDTGGAEMMLFKLVSTMDTANFQNIVVSMTDVGPVGESLENMNIPVYSLGMRKGVPSIRGLWRLFQLLRREKPQIFQTWLYHADLLGLLVGKLAGILIISWNIRCSEMDLSQYSRLTSLVLRMCSRLSGFVKAVIINSVAGREFHRGLGYNPPAWHLIPNGFDIKRFRPDTAARNQIRQEIGAAEEELIVGHVARYDPMKDHENFLEGARLLNEAESGIRVRFLLIGRGVDYQNQVLVDTVNRKNLSGCSTLLGERSDVPSLMAAMDIFVSSSCGEGFPNVIGEAMACAIPCVVTDVGDSALLLGGTGMVVPSKNPRALADSCLELVVLGHEGRAKLGSAARQRIEKYFNITQVVGQYEKVFEQLAGTPMRGGR